MWKNKISIYISFTRLHLLMSPLFPSPPDTLFPLLLTLSLSFFLTYERFAWKTLLPFFELTQSKIMELRWLGIFCISHLSMRGIPLPQKEKREGEEKKRERKTKANRIIIILTYFFVVSMQCKNLPSRALHPSTPLPDMGPPHANEGPGQGRMHTLAPSCPSFSPRHHARQDSPLPRSPCQG